MKVLPQRRSVRLRHYNYASNGAYFVTLCAHEKYCLFGEIENDMMFLNEVGRLVTDAWMELPRRHQGVELDKFLVMPNHLHGIIVLSEAGVGAGTGAMNLAPTGMSMSLNKITNPHVGAQFIAPVPQTTLPTLGEIIRGFKARCTSAWRKMYSNHRSPLWQRNYYEHVIRNESSLHSIREYIVNNPQQWGLDRENPDVRKIEDACDEESINFEA